MIELADIRSRVVTILQDTSYTRWTKTELNNYIHDSLLDLVRTIRLPTADVSLTINSSTYLLSLPTNLMDISGGSIAGRELPMVTTSEMKSLASQGRLPTVIKDGEYSVTEIFGNPIWSKIEDWTASTGTPQALVIDQKSSSIIRVWPIPTDEALIKLTGTKRPTRMSDEVPYSFTDDTHINYPEDRIITNSLNGWTSTDLLVDDTSRTFTFDSTAQTIEGSDGSTLFEIADTDYIKTCDIDYVWVDALTFGALERAYLKEHDLRNVEKSEYFKNKKLAITIDAHRTEPIHPASITGGVNLNRFIVRR